MLITSYGHRGDYFFQNYLKMRVLFTIVLFFFLSASFSQEYNPEKCDSIEPIALERIPEYYAEEKPEQVWKTIVKWQESCGMNELICATHAFFDLISGAFESEKPPEDMLTCLAAYSELDTSVVKPEYQEVMQKYMDFLTQGALNLDTLGMNADEKFIRSFFAEETDFEPLSLLYPKAELSKDYTELMESFANQPEVHIGGYLGWFVPLGNNKLFGQHLVLGANVNVKYRKHLFGLEADLKAGESKEEYMVDEHGFEIPSKGFNQALVNVFYGQRIFHEKRHSLWIRGGVGGDFITVFPPEDQDGDGEVDLDGRYLNSINMNLGLQYQIRFSNGVSLSPGMFYNITNFHNDGGTNVKGNYMTFRLLLGYSTDSRRNHILSKYR